MVAMELVVLRQGFANTTEEEEMYEEEGGCAKGRVRLPSHPLTIYRGKGRGGRPL